MACAAVPLGVVLLARPRHDDTHESREAKRFSITAAVSGTEVLWPWKASDRTLRVGTPGFQPGLYMSRRMQSRCHVAGRPCA